MNRKERLAAMETACNALSKAGDTLMDAKNEYNAARKNFWKTIGVVTGHRCAELHQFYTKWEMEWQEKWGYEWEYIPYTEFDSILDDPLNAEKHAEYIAYKNMMREECNAIEKRVDAGNKKNKQIRDLEWNFK